MTARKRKARPGRFAGRGALLVRAMRALVILRRGRWTMAELAAELEVNWRTAYYLVEGLRAAGIEVEVSHDTRGAAGHYTVPAESLRRLLRLP